MREHRTVYGAPSGDIASGVMGKAGDC